MQRAKPTHYLHGTRDQAPARFWRRGIICRSWSNTPLSVSSATQSDHRSPDLVVKCHFCESRSSACSHQNSRTINHDSAPQFLSVHLFAILGAIFISPLHKVSRLNLFLCWIYCQLGTFGITLGYHRMWSHRAYTATEPFRWFLAFAASFGFQGSARWWVLRHRLHHRWTDSEHDP